MVMRGSAFRAAVVFAVALAVILLDLLHDIPASIVSPLASWGEGWSYTPFALSETSHTETARECRENVTILGVFALTRDMPCTALFELTLGSLLINVPELRYCPKIFLFTGMRKAGRTELDQKRYDDFFKNIESLAIPNVELISLQKQSTLIESMRFGISRVDTKLVFVWQPDLMLLRRPSDWSKIVQKLLEDDIGPTRPDTIRDVHFRYHHEHDVGLHGPRRHFNYSGFQDDVYIVNYCDQIHLATTSFYKDHVFPAIDLKLQHIPQEERGFAGEYMEGNNDAINANHTSVGYGSCYKAHCDKEKRDLA